MEENKINDIRMKEDEELREYEKKSLIARAAVSLGTLILSGVAGYLTGKLRRR